MRVHALTPRERRLLFSELRGATHDGVAIVNSILSAFSFVALTGFQFSLPPLTWLTTYWSQLCQTFWTFLLSWLPVDIALTTFTTNSVTMFMIVGLMFVRGQRAGYVGLNAFSIDTQDLFTRLLYYGAVIFAIFRMRYAAPVIFEVYSDKFALLIISSSVVIVGGYGILRLYVKTLRRLRVVPLLIARPWLIAVGPLCVLFLDAVLPNHDLGSQIPDDLTLLIAGSAVILFQLFLTLFIFFFGTPLAIWFVRIVGAMTLAIASLLVLDSVWLTVQGSHLTLKSAETKGRGKK